MTRSSMQHGGDEPDRVRESPTEPRDVDAAFRDGTRIDRALARAVRAALTTHKKLGNSIAVGRDGKVVWISPDRIPVDD